METKFFKIDGSEEQIAKFVARVGQPLDMVAADALGMFGLADAPVKFSLVLMGSSRAVQNHYALLHPNRAISSHSYTSGTDIIISSPDASARVLAHEVAHAMLNWYFRIEPVPTALHELIAQTVEDRVCKKYLWD